MTIGRTRLMMTADAVGGIWTYAAELLRGLAARGYQTRLVTMGPRPSLAQREMIAGIPALSVIETDLHLEWQDPGARDTARAAAVLSDIARQFAPEIVHLNSFREAAYEWSCPVVCVAHSCARTWADGCRATLAGDQWRQYEQSVGLGLRSATSWVAPTAAFADAVLSLYGIERDARVIHNGLAPPQAQPTARMPVIFGAGRVWDRAKNLATLAAAADWVVWPIEIAGSCGAAGNDEATLPATAAWLGELSRDAVVARMRAAEIFCSPAVYEPFGLSVLEAASAGCALVLSDIPTFRELWDGAALFVEPHDRQALVDALNTLCLDDTRRQHLQMAASIRAHRYPIARTADAYHALYSSLRTEAQRGLPMELSA